MVRLHSEGQVHQRKQENPGGSPGPLLSSSCLLSLVFQPHSLSATHTQQPYASGSRPAFGPGPRPGLQELLAMAKETFTRQLHPDKGHTQLVGFSPPNMSPPQASKSQCRPCCPPTAQARLERYLNSASKTCTMAVPSW